jgi:predicted DNA-binding transcriptional regulator AlpA
MQVGKWSAKQSIKEQEISNPEQSARDFRAVFYELDPAVLITADEFSALMCITRAAFNFRLHIGKVPDPVIRANQCVRWRVSDVREWLEAMPPVPADPGRVLGVRAQRILDRESAGSPRRGRTRRVADEK